MRGGLPVGVVGNAEASNVWMFAYRSSSCCVVSSFERRVSRGTGSFGSSCIVSKVLEAVVHHSSTCVHSTVACLRVTPSGLSNSMEAVYFGVRSGLTCQREGLEVEETVREPGCIVWGVSGRFSNWKMFGIDRKTDR